jgi:hypothetical protein
MFQYSERSCEISVYRYCTDKTQAFNSYTRPSSNVKNLDEIMKSFVLSPHTDRHNRIFV